MRRFVLIAVSEKCGNYVMFVSISLISNIVAIIVYVRGISKSHKPLCCKKSFVDSSLAFNEKMNVLTLSFFITLARIHEIVNDLDLRRSYMI